MFWQRIFNDLATIIESIGTILTVVLFIAAFIYEPEFFLPFAEWALTRMAFAYLGAAGLRALGGNPIQAEQDLVNSIVAGLGAGGSAYLKNIAIETGVIRVATLEKWAVRFAIGEFTALKWFANYCIAHPSGCESND